MSNSQKWAVIITLCLIALGSACAFWDRAIPNKTLEQILAQSYYKCAKFESLNGRDDANLTIFVNPHQ